MAAGIPFAKSAPGDVVAAVWDAVSAGEHEVIVDDMSRGVKAALSGPIGALYPQLR